MNAVKKFERIVSNRTSRLLKGSILRLKAWISTYTNHDLQVAEKQITKAIQILEKADRPYSIVVALQDLSNVQIHQGKA
ncbi:MAG: hypothetical protein ACK2TX_05645, partial [Anaerolineales bacterium]